MSKVSISGDNQGSGTFTIAAPNSNNNRTFSLPDEAGTALTDASNLEPQVKTTLNATGDAPLFACRAFCNFDGTGTVSIRESGNVSSITDNGTGKFRVNFLTDIQDNNYAVNITGISLTRGNPVYAFMESTVSGLQSAVQADSYVEIFSGTPHTTNGTSAFREDIDIITFAIFR